MERSLYAHFFLQILIWLENNLLSFDEKNLIKYL